MNLEEELAKELEEPLILKKDEIKKYKTEQVKEVKKEGYEKKEEVKKDITKKEYYSKVIEFTNRIKKTYGDLVKSVLIFGSAARGDMKKTSDIDLWVVIDDTATKGTSDLNKIRLQLQLIAKEMKDLHVQMNGLTEFWGWMKRGSPELFNFLRSGLVIYDTGFIKPVQRMLELGLLPPSDEAVKLKVKSSKNLVNRVEIALKNDIFDLRYAATDICQSVIMYFYREMPDQKMMPKFLEKLVKEKGLESEYIDKYKELNKMWKDVEHKVIKKVTPDHVKRAMELALDIIERMKKFLPKDMLEADVGWFW